MAKSKYGPQVIVETNDFYTDKEKADKWIAEVVAHVKAKYPYAHIETHLFYVEQ